MTLVEEALARLDALPLLAHCGEPFGEDWAVKIPDDWQDALLTWRMNGDDGAGWLAAPNALIDWANQHRPDLGEAYQRDLRNQMLDPTMRFVKDRIWPKLPSRIRRGGGQFVEQVRGIFAWDLRLLAIDQILCRQGKSEGYYGWLRRVYEAGRFPCGVKPIDGVDRLVIF